MIAPTLWIGFTIMLYRCSISRHSAVRIVGVPVSFIGMMVGMLWTIKWAVLGI